MPDLKFISGIIFTIAIILAIVAFIPNKVVDTSDTATTTVETSIEATTTVDSINLTLPLKG